MNKIYQLTDESKNAPLLSYRYIGKEVTFHALKGIEPDDDILYLRTEHDVISEWATASKDGLLNDFKASVIPCWEGHYEQFGMVMLNLAKMCRNRKNFKGDWSPLLDEIMPKSGLHDLILSGFSYEIDRIFYRSWFMLLGHPSFLKQSLSGLDTLNPKLTELRLLLSFNEINLRLLSKIKS